MNDFKPYKKEATYMCELTHSEAMFIQRVRKIDYGSIKVHIVNKKIIRREDTDSKLSEQEKDREVTIALEVINN